MKKLILAAVLVTSATMVEAKPFCESAYGFAEAVMTARQNGASMSWARDQIKKFSDNKYFMEWANGIIYDAYYEPVYVSQQYKQLAINEFAETEYYACVEVFGDKK